MAFLKGPAPLFSWGAVRPYFVCGSTEETGQLWDQCETRTLPHSMWLSARGCWLDEVMSGLQAEGSGNYADLGTSLLPFPTFAQSQSGFWIFVFNQKHTVFLSPSSR